MAWGTAGCRKALVGGATGNSFIFPMLLEGYIGLYLMAGRSLLLHTEKFASYFVHLDR